jgi:hypothetical protein
MGGAGRSGGRAAGGGRSGSGRSADGGAAGSRGSAARQRRQLAILPILVVFYIVYFHVVGSGPNRSGGSLLAVGVGALALLLRPFAVLLVMLCLRARVVHLRVGVGPFLGHRVTPARVVGFRAIPITISCHYLPRPRHYGRDLRVMSAALIFCPLLLTLLGTLALPPYARVIGLAFGLTVSVADAVSRPRGSVRTLGARAFRKPRPEQDPQFGDPEWGHLAQGRVAARFGEFDTAAEQLAYLKAREHEAADTLEAAIQCVRGAYEPVIRALLRLTGADRPADPGVRRLARPMLLGELAFVVLLTAERDRRIEARAAALADQALDRRGRHASAAADTPALALRALVAGDPGRSLSLTRRQLAAAVAPADVADALCTRARAQAALGDAEGAHRTLGRAAAAAPWYPRVGVVQAALGGQIAAAVDLPAVDSAAEARLFEDPWSTSEA